MRLMFCLSDYPVVHCGLDQFVLTWKLQIFDALLIPNATVAIFFT